MGVAIYISNSSSPLCLTIKIRTMRYVTDDACKIPAERHVFINRYRELKERSSCITLIFLGLPNGNQMRVGEGIMFYKLW